LGGGGGGGGRRDWRDINEVLKRDPLCIPIHTIFAGQWGAVFTQGGEEGGPIHTQVTLHVYSGCYFCFSVGGGSQRAQPQRNDVSRSRNVDSRVLFQTLAPSYRLLLRQRKRTCWVTYTHTDTENKETTTTSTKNKNRGGGILTSTNSSFQSQLMRGIQ